MIPDSPIVKDIRKIRMEISEQFGHDAKKYGAYLKEKYGENDSVEVAQTNDQHGLEDCFDAAMKDLYKKEKEEVNYNAARFLNMLSTHGGLATARKLLYAPEVSDGFIKLWENQRLDLTVEALILNPAWNALFDQNEKEIARSRLEKYGYSFQNSHNDASIKH